jgi:hypothetical protein
MVIGWIIALMAFPSLITYTIILLACFIVVVFGIVIIKYFKFIFGYLVLFGVLFVVLYAGSIVWPVG